MVVWESVPTSVSGIGGELAELLPELHHGGQVLQVDLVDDPGAGRDHPEVAEGPLGELEQLVALDVPLHFQLHVELERLLRAEIVHLDRVVDHQVAGHHRVDPVGVAAHPAHGVAHGGEIDHAGHPGEVLQHHPGGHERDLAPDRARPVPAPELANVLLGHDASAGEPERVLQEHPDARTAGGRAPPRPGGRAPPGDRWWPSPCRAGGCRGSRMDLVRERTWCWRRLG